MASADEAMEGLHLGAEVLPDQSQPSVSPGLPFPFEQPSGNKKEGKIQQDPHDRADAGAADAAPSGSTDDVDVAAQILRQVVSKATAVLLSPVLYQIFIPVLRPLFRSSSFLLPPCGSNQFVQEFYFSDANLPTDDFLIKRVRQDPEGWGKTCLFLCGLTEETILITMY
jgi:hypothetical protein